MNIEDNASGAFIDSKAIAEIPCPTEHPTANTPPIPIITAPVIWRWSSRGSSQASNRKCPFIKLPVNAPAQTPQTDPIPKFKVCPDEVMKYKIVEPTGAVNPCETGRKPEKPTCAIRCVPIHPLATERPTKAPQMTLPFSSQKALFQTEIRKHPRPIAGQYSLQAYRLSLKEALKS